MAPKKSEKKTATKEVDEKERLTTMMVAASDKLPEKIRPYAKQAAPVLALIAVGLMDLLPYVVEAFEKAQEFIAKIPEKIVFATLGFLLCFFGGIFPATIAAGEAAVLTGGVEALNALKDLAKGLDKIKDANKKDDDVDANKDGVDDVDQIPKKELLVRKMLLVVRTVDPEKLNHILGVLMATWLGVLATLKVQFAKTITLGHVIGDQLYFVVKHAEPAIEPLIPEDYRKWVPVVLKWSTKLFAMQIAWFIQRILSAVHSAIRGGLIFSRLLLAYLHETGKIHFPDDKASFLDEAIGWGVAGVGLIVQYMLGFSVPFPLNLLLLPVTMVESFVQYSVSS